MEKGIEIFLQICTGFTVVCVAIGWLIKIIKNAKQPISNVDEKLQRDYKRINEIDKEIEELQDTLQYIKASLKLQMENDLVILEHMRTNNSTGKIAEREEKTKQFLLEHQQTK